MTNSVRKSDKPKSTWFGGMSCDVTARRANDSTMMMRVNPVTHTSKLGMSTSAPRNRAVCSGGDRFCNISTRCKLSSKSAAIIDLQEAVGSGSGSGQSAWSRGMTESGPPFRDRCLLPSAHCLLPTADCRLPPATRPRRDWRAGRRVLMPVPSTPIRISRLPRCTRCTEQRLPNGNDSIKRISRGMAFAGPLGCIQRRAPQSDTTARPRTKIVPTNSRPSIACGLGMSGTAGAVYSLPGLVFASSLDGALSPLDSPGRSCGKNRPAATATNATVSQVVHAPNRWRRFGQRVGGIGHGRVLVRARRRASRGEWPMLADAVTSARIGHYRDRLERICRLCRR